MKDLALQSGLDYVFSFFARGHRRQTGRYDREVRRPDIFAAIAADHRIFPPPERTILITGSKGKGSCARLVAAYLQQQGKKVGLILTPEERHHLDRIRINGEPVGAADFLRVLQSFKAALERTADGTSDTYYHPPTAIFLLIALKLFSEQQVDYIVIEGGRGARYDEIGQIPAQLGIVTSILPEHLGKLGPTLKDLCVDKFSLADSCRVLICSRQAWMQAGAHHVELGAATVIVMDPPHSTGAGFPKWLGMADALARAAISTLGMAPGAFPGDERIRASCQIITASSSPLLRTEEQVFLDGAVTADCLDFSYMRSAACRPGAIVLGMTADKDMQGIVTALSAAGFDRHFFFLPVSATEHVLPSASVTHWTASFDTADGLSPEAKAALVDIVTQYRRVYVIGVQVFLRSVRNALLSDNPMSRISHDAQR